MAVTLQPATPAEAPLLQNLMQLYTHDFSEFWAGTDRGDLSPEGLFAPYPLDGYWSDPARSASLILSDGVLAGFVLVNDHSHSGRPLDHSVAEFFVLRKHRGGGVGRLAALATFTRQPGIWEAAVARRNLKALAFWRRTIQGAAQASEIEELDVQSPDWNGPILRFRWT